MNHLSLNEDARKREIAEEKKRKDQRNAERKAHPEPTPVALEVSLDTVNKPELPKVTEKKKPAKVAASKTTSDDDSDEEPVAGSPDPVRNEAIHILQDYTDLVQSLRTAHAASAAN